MAPKCRSTVPLRPDGSTDLVGVDSAVSAANGQGDDERGATLFLLVIAMLIVIMSAALALDLSVTASRGQNLQNAADSAALAGVQALRGQGDTATVDEMEAAAELAVSEMLAQNGIDLNAVTVGVTFPDPLNQTEVKVSLTEADVGTFLDGFTGGSSGVERTGTAKYESCDIGCIVPIEIPEPFNAIEVGGTGDGWTPLVVDNRVYALNHHSSGGYILCADALTDDHCWEDAGRPAYASGESSVYTSDVPFAAVHDGVIFWTASTSTGSSVYCWQTVTDTPCSQSYKITDLEADTQPRVGGMVINDGLLYTFGQDHLVHCIVPTVPMSTCSGYDQEGEKSELAERNFPTNDPEDGNAHGDQAFTVVDHDNGRLYWLTQITNPVASGGNLALGQPTLQSSDYSGSGGDSSNAVDGSSEQTWSSGSVTHTGNEANPWWQVDLGEIENLQQIQLLNRVGCCQDRLKDFYVFVSDTDMQTRSLSELLADTSVLQIHEPGEVADSWSTAVTGAGRYLRVQIADTDTDPLSLAEVIVTGVDDGSTTVDPTYASGTWLQCWDTVFAEPCSQFVASAVSDEAHRWWGRNMLKRNSAGDVEAVCVFVDFNNVRLPCVDNETGASVGEFTQLAAQVQAVNNTKDFMGEPYDFQELNRVFIPASYYNSTVVCWDFSTGFCGSHSASTPTNGSTLDYGYEGVGECLFGLGHRAYFWSFSAMDVTQECDSSSVDARVEPCPCGGELKWGVMNFDVNLGLFDRFEVRLYNPAGEQVYPVDGSDDPPPHSLIHDGTSIDLRDFPISGIDDYLTINVFVQTSHDPWAAEPQVLEVNFDRQPRLID